MSFRSVLLSHGFELAIKSCTWLSLYVASIQKSCSGLVNVVKSINCIFGVACMATEKFVLLLTKQELHFALKLTQ